MTTPDQQLAEENARLRARIADLERRALVVSERQGVRVGLDGLPVPTTPRRVFGRLAALLMFLLGIGIGFGFAMRNPDFKQGFQDGMRNPSPGAEVPPPSR
jgi:hypothetical protein